MEQTMTEFLHMGGYAAFIWPSWGLALVVIIGITLNSFSRDRRVQKELDGLETSSQNQQPKPGAVLES
jgi:heme exporter protein D